MAVSELNQSVAPEQPGQVSLWRRVAPIAVGLALLAWVISRLDLAAFVTSLGSTNYLGFIAFTVIFTVALLVTDTFATRSVYASTLGRVAFTELFVVRAASYLPSILNHHVGQAWLTYFLARAKGAPLLRVAGATLLVYATTFAALFLVLLSGLPFQHGGPGWVVPLSGLIALGAVVYLMVLWQRPAFLVERQLLAPLFDVGVSGQLRLVLYRVPHIAVQFVGAWVPFLFFGIEIPLADALLLMPLLMFVVALPVSPQGLGTRDALALTLFSGYATGTAEQRASAVAATTLSWLCAITLIQGLVSPLFMRRAYRLLGSGSAARDPT